MDFKNIKNIKKLPINQKIVKKAIVLILMITFFRGIIYATIFPLWQAPDEPVQFEYVDFYAKKHLPFKEKNMTYKNNDSLLLEKVDKEILDSWYDLKSWEYISWENENNWYKSGKRLKRVSDRMGGVFYSIPPGYAIASLPLYSLVYFDDVRVRAYAMRLFSVILSVLVVYLGYRTAKELFPEDIFVLLGTPLFITFVPMFTHMSGAVNPDNLANLGAALFILFSVKILKKFSWITFFVLLLSVFLGIFAKRTAFFTLIMLFLIPIFILILSENDRLKVLYRRFGAILFYCVIASLSGIYLVPIVGNRLGFFPFDLTSVINIKNAIISYTQTNSINEFIESIKYFVKTFWAFFAWGIPINKVSYSILWNFTIIPLISLLFVQTKEIFYKRSLFSKYQIVSMIYLTTLFNIAFLIIVIKQIVIIHENIPGRYIFPAIIPIATITTIGLSQLFKNKRLLLLIMFLILFLFDSSSLLVYIIPFFYKTSLINNLSFLSSLSNLFNKPAILNSVYFYILIFLSYFCLLGYLAYNLLIVEKDSRGIRG